MGPTEASIVGKAAGAFAIEWAGLVESHPHFASLFDKETAELIFNLGFAAGMLAYPELFKQAAIEKASQ